MQAPTFSPYNGVKSVFSSKLISKSAATIMTSTPPKFSPPDITISRVSSQGDAPEQLERVVQPSTTGTLEPHQVGSNNIELDAEINRLQRGKDYKNLDELLRDYGIPHENGKMHFWPPSCLHVIMTKDRIMAELAALRHHHPELREEIIKDIAIDIWLNNRIVFAILCLLGKGQCIVDFIEHNITDMELPLVICTNMKASRHYLARKATPSVPLQCLEDWATNERESFNHMQYRLAPAYLDLELDPLSQRRTIRHETFSPTTILPFLELEAKDHGGFGTVSRVKIHRLCHGFCNILHPVSHSFSSHNSVLTSRLQIDTNDEFALKEIMKQSSAQQNEGHRLFWQEVDNLKRFNGFSHPNLVTLLMTWTMKNRYYLLFPLADCDLDRYWDQNRVSHDKFNVLDLETVRWLSKQVQGMTSAMNSIHNPRSELLSPQDHKFGRHGDLKPENILWYRSKSDKLGILVIADLGLSALNSILSRSNAPNGQVPGTPRYRPPESDLLGGKISRSYDIWTFGCVLLELVCWALGGPEAREQFFRKRMSPYIAGSSSDIFFDVKRQEEGAGFVIMVKEEVTNVSQSCKARQFPVLSSLQEIRRLHEHPRCTAYFHDLLYLIEEEMVIVLSPSKRRISSIDLVEHLRMMDERAGDEYYQQPCDQPRLAKSYDPVGAELRFGIIENLQPGDLPRHRGPSQAALSAHQLNKMADG
jgi:serine/threonine protein kinase